MNWMFGVMVDKIVRVVNTYATIVLNSLPF